jgi:hypothetical protein
MKDLASKDFIRDELRSFLDELDRDNPRAPSRTGGNAE